MKGKPWAVEDEKKLRDLFKSGVTDLGILRFRFDGLIIRPKCIFLI